MIARDPAGSGDAGPGSTQARALRKALLYPDAVAIVGASDSADKLTARPQRFLDAHGYAGEVYPVNPRRETVLGRPAYASVGDIPGGVEHAYILLEADPALAALEACASAGVKVASVLADGFAEAGPAGEERQRRLVDISRAAGMLLVGPNSMGVVETRRGFACTTNAAFRLTGAPPGGQVVLSQSGSMIGAIHSRGAAVGVGFGAFVSVGNEAAAGVGELGALLVDDPAVDGFVLFLETVRRRDALAEFAALAQAAGKPVIAYLVGRSEAGRTLAVSHTGAMVGGARALESFLAAQGVRLVEGFETLIEAPAALALAPRLERRPRAATVVTTTGGGGGMVYDQLGLRGVALAGMPVGAAGRLAAAGLDPRPGPLVDVTLAGARYETMKAVMREILTDQETGIVVAAIGSSAQFDPELAVRPIVDARREIGDAGAPVVAVPLPQAEDSLRLLNAGGVPAFRTVESCAESVALALRRAPDRERVTAALPAAVRERIARAAEGLLPEQSATAVFEALGIAVPPTLALPEDLSLPPRLPFEGPYVAKLLGAGVAHKSELGAVELGLADREAVATALAAMRRRTLERAPALRVEGALVQRLECGLGEAIVGLARDPVVGPMVSVGVGGALSEIYADLAVRPAPVGAETARAMVEEVRGLAALRGYRDAPRGDLEALADAVARLSLLALDPRIGEAEINPLLVRREGEGAVALDALIRVS